MKHIWREGHAKLNHLSQNDIINSNLRPSLKFNQDSFDACYIIKIIRNFMKNMHSFKPVMAKQMQLE